MGLKLVDLLRWSKPLELKSPDGQPLVVDDKPVTVYLRIIGDHDLEESFKSARAASSRIRRLLQDRSSDEFQSNLAILQEADREACYTIIQSARTTDFSSLAYANVERPELPKIEEVAVDADAPTLEEQEKLDKLGDELEAKYRKELDEYVKTKITELREELDKVSDDELRNMAIEQMTNIVAVDVFMKELADQKAAKSVFTDRTFKEKAFDSTQEFQSLAGPIKRQILDAYRELELGPEEVKN